VALQEALALLKEESSSPAGPAYQAKWSEYFAKKSAEAARMVMDALKDAATVAPELCRFAQTVSGQEAAFFGQCGRMTLAHMSGQAQLYTLNFYREADRLEAKRLKSWEEIERVNLPVRLDAALQDYQNTWTVNVDGLSDEDKNALREVWKTELDVLAKGIVEAKQDRVRDQIRMYLNDKMQELMTKINGSKGGGE